MPEGGPYMTMAVLCEKVLEEKDGVRSLIRMVDRVIVSPGPGAPEKMPPIPIQILSMIAFKSGDRRESYTLKLTVQTPSGNEDQLATFPLLFEGEDRGVALQVHLAFQAMEQGLYWFGVYLEEQLFTRIPLRIIYQRVGIGPPSVRP